MEKIENPETKVLKGMELNDKDYLTLLLTSLKDIEKNYVIAMTEASNEYLYKQLEEVFLQIADFQREVYEVMFQNGWYKLETVDTLKLNNKLETLNQELSDLKN